MLQKHTKPQIFILIVCLSSLASGCKKDTNTSSQPTSAEALKIRELEAQVAQLKNGSGALLTRDKALSILQQRPMESVFRSIDPSSLFYNPEDIRPFILAAEGAGILRRMPGAFGSTELDRAYFETTPKGLQFLTQQNGQYIYKMADLKALEVTAIGASSQQSGKTVSAVSFKFLYTPTFIGELWEQTPGHQRNYSGIATGEAIFSLYDDGWHLESWQQTHQ